MEIDIKNDCSRFPMHSRQWQLCEGLTDMSLDRVNKIRAMYGIPPLVDEAPLNDPAAPTTSKVVVVRSAKNTTRNSQPTGCCGGGQSVANAVADTLNGWGPGSQLLRLFHDAGFESCPACQALAIKMDQWSLVGCRQRTGEIVADILPRAIEWERERAGWLAKLIPGAVTLLAIQVIVGRAIVAAETAQPVVQKKTTT